MRLKALTAAALSMALVACTTSRTTVVGQAELPKPPPPSEKRIDLGPIVDDDDGMDIAPLVAGRMAELHLADARVVARRDPRVPYVNGTVSLSRGEEVTENPAEMWIVFFLVAPVVDYFAEKPGAVSATLNADLKVTRGDARPEDLNVHDGMRLRYRHTSQSGREILDGIAYGISAAVN